MQLLSTVMQNSVKHQVSHNCSSQSPQAPSKLGVGSMATSKQFSECSLVLCIDGRCQA